MSTVILSDLAHSVLKFGVGIGNDVKRLATAFDVETLGCVDLQNVAVRCGIRYDMKRYGQSSTYAP